MAVDKSAYGAGVASGTRGKMKELKDLGAAIHMCGGRRGSRIFHWKCIMINSKVVFTGSANATQGCLNNFERTMRMVGPCVQPIKDGLEDAQKTSVRF